MNYTPNLTTQYEFTILVPVYNEEANMARVEKALADYLPQAAAKSCVLFIDDGSTDASPRLIADICARHPDFFFITLKCNGGLSGALKAGIDHTWSPLLGYIDSDLQTNPEDFNLLLAQMEGNALATGIRANRKDTIFKKLQSKIANGFRRKMTGDGVRDTGCPLKVIRTEYARKFPMFTGMHRFLPALVMLQQGGVAQVPVRHYPRVAGVSKYHLWNRLKGPFVDCFAYRWMKKRYINYNIGSTNLAKNK